MVNDAKRSDGKSPAEKSSSEEEVRERIIGLGFGGDRGRFEAFIDALRAALPPTVGVALRGSTVTGERWADGQPFDAAGPGTSDLDLTLMGGDALKLWKEDAFYIPGLHTKPLCDKDPDVAPALTPLRRALQRLAGRPVNIQATSDMVLFVRDVLLDQPYVTLIERRDDDEAAAGSGGDRGAAA